jgi:hypothetical protein
LDGIVDGLEEGLVLVDCLERFVDSVVRCLVGVTKHVRGGSKIVVEDVDGLSEGGVAVRCGVNRSDVGVESFDLCRNGGGVFGDMGDSMGSGGGGAFFLFSGGLLDGVFGVIVAQLIGGVGVYREGFFVVGCFGWGVGGVARSWRWGAVSGRRVVVAGILADVRARVYVHLNVGRVGLVRLCVSAFFFRERSRGRFVGGEGLFLNSGGSGGHRKFGISCFCGSDKESAIEMMVVDVGGGWC